MQYRIWENGMDRRFQKGVGAQMKICPKCNTGNGEKAI